MACTAVYSTVGFVSDGQDGSVTEEDVETMLPDGGRVPREADTDGPTDLDADGPAADAGPFCPSLGSTPTFCRDFDDGQPFSSGFVVDVGNGNQLTADTAAARSAPASLKSSVPASASDDVAYMYRAFPNTAQDIALGFDVLVEQGTGSKAPIVVGLRLSDPEVQSLVFFLGDGVGGIEEQYKVNGSARKYSTFYFTSAPKVGTWSRVEIHTVVTPTPHVTVTLNGLSVASMDLHPSWVPSNPVLLLGITYRPPEIRGVPWTVRLDNVSVTLK